MAAENRDPVADLKSFFQQLGEKPYRYELYPLLRRFESLCREQPRLGRSLHPTEDRIRLGQTPSLIFAPVTLESLTFGKTERPPQLNNYAFGLLGPNGPLPLHLTEYARDRLRNSNDATFSRFLDLFHHRLISLFYRAWADAQPTVSFDRAEEDRFAGYVDALFGLGLKTLKNREALPDGVKRHFSGHFSAGSRHPEAMVAMIRSYFQVPASIDEFLPNWVEIPAQNRCQLGLSRDNGRLGINLTLGLQVQLYQNKFRLNLGPMDREDFERFHRSGESYQRLQALLRHYFGLSFSWEIRLILKKEQVPSVQLGDQSRLAWNGWLAHNSALPEDKQVVL